MRYLGWGVLWALAMLLMALLMATAIDRWFLPSCPQSAAHMPHMSNDACAEAGPKRRRPTTARDAISAYRSSLGLCRDMWTSNMGACSVDEDRDVAVLVAAELCDEGWQVDLLPPAKLPGEWLLRGYRMDAGASRAACHKRWMLDELRAP